MPRNNELIELRNKNLKKQYHVLAEKYPNWKYDAILERLSSDFYISKRTISSILNG